MYKIILALIFLIALANSSYNVDGTLSCGQSTDYLVFSDDDADFYLLDVSIADEFQVSTCGNYYNGGYYTNTKITVYKYDGSLSASSVDDGDLTYYDYSSYFSSYYYDGDYPDGCTYSDALLDVSEEDKDSDYYAVEVDMTYTWWNSYSTESYVVNLVCGSIVTMAGSLDCGEEVSRTFVDDEEYWFLDISSASSSFSISTCGTNDLSGIDTILTLYGYEGDLSADSSWTDSADWTVMRQGYNNDDLDDYCSETSYDRDSFIYEDEMDYDSYVGVVSENFGDGEGKTYSLKLECDGSSGGSSSSDALTSSASTGVVMVAVIVPLVILIGAFWMYRRKQSQPQQNMNAYYGHE